MVQVICPEIGHRWDSELLKITVSGDLISCPTMSRSSQKCRCNQGPGKAASARCSNSFSWCRKKKDARGDQANDHHEENPKAIGLNQVLDRRRRQNIHHRGLQYASDETIGSGAFT